VLHWRPERCLAECALPECTQTLHLPALSPAQAAAQGARTLLIGTVSAGGALPSEWLPVLIEALDADLHIASGMHQRLTDVPELVAAASNGRALLLDVRDPDLWRIGERWTVGTGKTRRGQRILTVGTDCSVGKMYTALAIERALKDLDVDAEFKATGQTGIFIAGSGIPVDAVVSDFIAGAVEQLSPDDPGRCHVIEGQGSLHHPAFAGVSLGLLHGAQPDYLVICHEPTRPHMRHVPHLQPASLGDTVRLNLEHARRTNQHVEVLGFSINTHRLDDSEAQQLLEQIAAEYGRPAVDPVRTGVAPLLTPWS